MAAKAAKGDGGEHSVEEAYERVGAICLRFAGADVKLSHGAPAFHVKGKGFATFSRGGYGEPGPALWIKSTHADQRRLVEQEPARYFLPPYVGVAGWVAVRLDPALGQVGPADVDLAILVENAWSAIVPPRLAGAPPRVAPAPSLKLPMTDAKLSAELLTRLRAICEALSDVETEVGARHATFRVRGKVFAYFLDNHHGDEILAACFRTDREEMARLCAREPERFFLPQYMGARGWLGVRLDVPRTDWKDVAARAAASYAAVLAPKARKPAGTKSTATKVSPATRTPPTATTTKRKTTKTSKER